MKIPHLNFNQILQLALVLALVVNALVHFQSPAYRYYQENVTRLNGDYQTFEKRIFSDLVPFILSQKTNTNESVSLTIDKTSSAPSDSSSVSSSSTTNYTHISISYSYAGSFGSCFTFEDRFYKVGDDFFGSPITYISPTLVRTSNDVYICHNQNHSSSVSRPLSMNKGGINGK